MVAGMSSFTFAGRVIQWRGVGCDPRGGPDRRHRRRTPLLAMAVQVAGGRVHALHVIRNEDKLTALHRTVEMV